VRTLSHAEARRVYDRIGSRQDTQGFYENPALDLLVAHADFAAAGSVFEFGCGTGRFAARLLGELLPQDARWRGVDLSPEMVRLARERLAPFGERAQVVQTAGEPATGEPDASYDRFVSNYVLDLLSEDDIRAVLAEAARILRPGGLLCLVGLTTGCTPASRVVARLWSAVHRLSPALVGGCRPLDLTPLLPEDTWSVQTHRRLSAFGVPSEVLVARRR
jgi:SAM-dependent methyltransferase